MRITLLTLCALIAAVLLVLPSRAEAAADPPGAGTWLWPVAGGRTVVEPFRAPAHAYGPGHRGIDIAADDVVRAPAAGVVAFRGTVVDRPLITIDHGGGNVSTLEPVQSELTPGTVVAQGEAIGTLSVGGHAARGALHIGVRWNDVYLNPMLMFGRVPRAVLIPCGASGC
ncbi:hypothetical protein GCM10025768_25240 [Microbacterium pseudoresistens]